MKNTNKLGDIGERLIAELFGGTLSEDKYDSMKDMILDVSHESVEVKTQRRDIYRNILTVRANQLIKCLSVDRLFFVEYDDTNYIKIFECTKRDAYIRFTTKDGRDMIGWNPIDMKKLFNVEDEMMANKMRTLSQSRSLKICQVI